MVSNILISVVCATRNAAETLPAMIESYRAESSPQTELIVVDACSTDHSAEIFSRYRDTVSTLIVESDKSIYEAWNKGIAVAKGDYVCFIGADDRIAAGLVAQLTARIKSNPSADFIHGYNVMCRQGYPVGIIGRRYSPSTFEKYMPVAHVMSAHKRSWLLSEGKFDESFKSSGDYDFLLRTLHRTVYEECDFVFAYVEDAGISRNSMLPLRESHAARIKNGVAYWKSLIWFLRGCIGMRAKKLLKWRSV
jgi:glycosyltransferase involved in cell wall biosynthesis